MEQAARLEQLLLWGDEWSQLCWRRVAREQAASPAQCPRIFSLVTARSLQSNVEPLMNAFKTASITTSRHALPDAPDRFKSLSTPRQLRCSPSPGTPHTLTYLAVLRTYSRTDEQ